MNALTKLEQEIEAKSKQTTYTVPRKKEINIVGKIEKLNLLKQQISDLKSRIQSVDADIVDSKLFIDSLTNKLEQISDSIFTRQSLGELPLTHCPQCLSPLPTTVQEGVCSLCHQPIDHDQSKTYASRIQQEIKMQIAESRKIIDSKEKRSQQYNGELATRIAEAEQLQRDINLSTKSSKPAGQDVLDRLYEARGSMKQELLYLKKQKRIAERYAQLSEEIAEKGTDKPTNRFARRTTIHQSKEGTGTDTSICSLHS